MRLIPDIKFLVSLYMIPPSYKLLDSVANILVDTNSWSELISNGLLRNPNALQLIKKMEITQIPESYPLY